MTTETGVVVFKIIVKRPHTKGPRKKKNHSDIDPHDG